VAVVSGCDPVPSAALVTHSASILFLSFTVCDSVFCNRKFSCVYKVLKRWERERNRKGRVCKR
jgi:hypothetical protein